MLVDALEAQVGTVIGQSRWFDIDQARIDQFADVTEDWQFIHVDAARAANTPFGSTVAHGYLTLSMLSAMAYDALPDFEGVQASVNYGFDRIRFLAPVHAGARLRATFVLQDVTRKPGKKVLLRLGVTMEMESSDTPALSAEWLTMYLL